LAYSVNGELKTGVIVVCIEITCSTIEALRGAMDLTKDNGGCSFIPIATKWLASGTDDDDY